MEIKRYGLTDKEIDDLKKELVDGEGMTEDEAIAQINDANRERAVEQLIEEGAIPSKWETVQASGEFKRLRELMPALHPAYIGFCMTSPNVDAMVPIPDDTDGWRNRYEQMKRRGTDGSSELDNLNIVLSEAFAGCDFDGAEIDGYDFSQENIDSAMSAVEDLMTEAENEPDPDKSRKLEELADKCRRIVDAQSFALNFLPVDESRR